MMPSFGFDVEASQIQSDFSAYFSCICLWVGLTT